MELESNAELFVFLDGAGELHWPNPSGSEPIAMKVAARFVRLILLLQQAWTLDEQLPRSIRGFRPAAALAAQYDVDGPAFAPEKQTIIHYLSQLSRKIGRTVGERPLLERAKGRGARLTYPLKITYLAR